MYLNRYYPQSTPEERELWRGFEGCHVEADDAAAIKPGGIDWRGLGMTECENVTPRVLLAGIKVLYEHGYVGEFLDVDIGLVVEIFRAMQAEQKAGPQGGM